MARSTLIPIPSDLTIADLDRAFGRRTVRGPGSEDGAVVGQAFHTAKRSKPGGPYRVTFAYASATYGRLGRVLLTPTADGRGLQVRSRDTAGRAYVWMLYVVAVLFVLIGAAMAPLDNWHLKGPLFLVGGGLLLGAFARWVSRANRGGESDEAAQAAALAFDIARQTRGDGVAADDVPLV